MSKLWIYGDSFSMPPSLALAPLDYATWTEQVCQQLGCNEIMNRARPGVSNDYIFSEIIKDTNSMELGDFCIIQTTQKNRQWFFEDPELSNYKIGDLHDYISRDQANAVKQYVTHLQRDELDDLRFIQFSLALERITTLAGHVRMLILPGFFGAHNIEGYLIKVSDNEFIDLNDLKTFYNKDGRLGRDPRHNHISPNNHVILANKVVNFFTTGQLVDLTTGFEKYFLK